MKETRVTMTIKNKVKHMVTTNTGLADSDKELLLHYWEMQGLGLSDSQKRIFLERCTTPETITRARRELRKEGIAGSEEVEQERYNKFHDYKNNKAVSWLTD